MLAEEELKRLKASYGQVDFNYDAETSRKTDNGPENPSECEKDEDQNEPDEIYVPHPQFIIPADVELVSATTFISNITILI